MKFDFKSLRKTFQDAAGQLKSLEAELEKNRLRRDEIAAAPMCLQDAEEHYHYRVDADGARYPDLMFRTQKSLLTHPLTTPAEGYNSADYDFKKPFFSPHISVGDVTASIHPGNPDNAFVGNQIANCYFFPAVMKAGLTAMLKTWDWSNAGLPRAERLKELQKLDKIIGDLESEQAELNREINSIRNNI